MNLLGVHLTLMMGPTIPVPVPFSLAEALQSVEVSHSDQGPSGFQLTFQVGRAGPLDLLDYAFLKNPLLRPFNRIILVVRFAIVPEVIIDGIVTNQQLTPSNEPGTSTLTLTGEDLSVMMDLEQLEESQREFPAQPDYTIVAGIVGKYLQYGLIPPTPPENPQSLTPSNPIEEIRQQPANLTDRAYLQDLAEMYGFVFYVTPGPVLGQSRVHWGPPERLTRPQGALSVNMGPASNVESINFQYDGMRPQRVRFTSEGRTRTVSSPTGIRSIPLASNRAEAKRLTYLTNDDRRRAETVAQGMVDRSFDEVVIANGQLDVLRYNGLLKARSLIGLRGVGKTYDGLYYVKSVTHSINKGRYTQSFSLAREGTGTTTPFVMP